MLNRKIIGIFGKTNSGKSSLLNALTGQAVSIVSEIEGTTTDTVSKIMELIPLGSVQFLDTAGLNDRSDLGEQRMAKALQAQARVDLALLLCDASSVDPEFIDEQTRRINRLNTPFLWVFSKSDAVDTDCKTALSVLYPQAIFVSVTDPLSIELLTSELIVRLGQLEEELPLIGDLVPSSGNVVLVCPIDSEAPKGRLILPQVQVLRDCLDHGIASVVIGVNDVWRILEKYADIDLIVTDSQVFKEVDQVVDGRVPLTSFSILLARQKGGFDTLLNGARTIRSLSDGAKVLIAETCTHNTSHEDIGRVKLPALLNRVIGKDLSFSFASGLDFPEDLSSYDLVIHCGGCMINRALMQRRIIAALEHEVPITNFGLALAELTGILERCVSPLGYGD